ncbi:MAG: manganese efflux pump MntP [Elusimicrobia bacterium RIFOXYB2_FULL_49_7]|nr:MAG: manganese efflux pump MntP [Elusimicrobia bacterium RIFOXYB2_FULL_49_7]
MAFPTLLFIGISLSMDALAVSITTGLTLQRARFAAALKVALYFGGAQALMPFLGWMAGARFQALISTIDHWLAFGLLTLIGGKMIYEAFKIEEAEKKDYLNTRVLMILAVATSIDAFAVGLSFAFLNVAILLPVVIIGVTTFVICFAGVLIGKQVGHFFESKIEALGGLILIGIGIKILVQHLCV